MSVGQNVVRTAAFVGVSGGVVCMRGRVQVLLRLASVLFLVNPVPVVVSGKAGKGIGLLGGGRQSLAHIPR